MYIERIAETTDSCFWSNVIKSLKILLENNCCRNKEVLLNYPYGTVTSLIRKEWLEKGILWFRDLIDEFHNILPIEEIHERYDISMNFLNYDNLKIIIQELVEWQDKPEHAEPLNRNSPLNT